MILKVLFNINGSMILSGAMKLEKICKSADCSHRGVISQIPNVFFDTQTDCSELAVLL